MRERPPMTSALGSGHGLCPAGRAPHSHTNRVKPRRTFGVSHQADRHIRSTGQLSKGTRSSARGRGASRAVQGGSPGRSIHPYGRSMIFREPVQDTNRSPRAQRSTGTPSVWPRPWSTPKASTPGAARSSGTALRTPRHRWPRRPDRHRRGAGHDVHSRSTARRPRASVRVGGAGRVSDGSGTAWPAPPASRYAHWSAGDAPVCGIWLVEPDGLVPGTAAEPLVPVE